MDYCISSLITSIDENCFVKNQVNIRAEQKKGQQHHEQYP